MAAKRGRAITSFGQAFGTISGGTSLVYDGTVDLDLEDRSFTLSLSDRGFSLDLEDRSFDLNLEDQ